MRNKASPLDESDALTVILADLTQREGEINERTRSENYLFVALITALAAIVAGIVAISPQIAQDTELVVFLPLLAATGALFMLALPVDLIHLSVDTELRRNYIQVVIEPRLRAAAANLPSSSRIPGPFVFEGWDRRLHEGPFNVLVGFRSGFVALPAAILGFYVAYLHTYVVSDWSRIPVWALVAEGAICATFICTVYWNARSYFRMILIMRIATDEPDLLTDGQAFRLPSKLERDSFKARYSQRAKQRKRFHAGRDQTDSRR